MVESGRFWFEGGRSGWYFFGSSSGSFHECLDVLLRAHFDVCVAHGRPDIGVAGGLLDAHQGVSLAGEPGTMLLLGSGMAGLVVWKKKFSSTGGWGFEAFKGDTTERVVKDPKADCFTCHETEKQTDFVFSGYRK